MSNGTASDASNTTSSMSVLGITFDPSSPAVFVEYGLVNVVVNSVIPLPLAGTMTAIGALLFGLVGGMAFNTATAVVGAYISLLAVRSGCRPCLERRLGRYHSRYKALDAALTAQGAQIALLIRLAPVSPMVLTNIMLSLTSISTYTYLWTCTIGIVPANLPFAYAADLGLSMAHEFPPKDPVMLSMTLIGFIASVAIAWKVGVIAKRVLARHGFGDEANASTGAADGLETAADDDATIGVEPAEQRDASVSRNCVSAEGDVELSRCSPNGACVSAASAGACKAGERRGLRLPVSDGSGRKFASLREEEEQPDPEL